MFTDEAVIEVKAGNGGAGTVAFNKNMMSLGPSGGSGGKGGSVYLEGVSDLGALRKFKYVKEVKADDGKNGRGQFMDGSDGEDVFVKVPVGTVIYNTDNKEEKEVVRVGEKLLVAKGGSGGKGNFHYRSSKNTSPKQFQEGKPGESFTLRLELRLMADIGLVGLPNAGKSTLLNELTKAHSKVGDYPFTTLEPHLGSYYGLIIADIPGLIEGASQGKGLGVKFLKHIKRTRIIFHLVSAESTDLLKDYRTIEKELALYDKDLAEKEEYLFLSKTDNVSEKELADKVSLLRKHGKEPIPISIHDFDSMEALKKTLNKIKDTEN